MPLQRTLFGPKLWGGGAGEGEGGAALSMAGGFSHEGLIYSIWCRILYRRCNSCLDLPAETWHFQGWVLSMDGSPSATRHLQASLESFGTHGRAHSLSPDNNSTRLGPDLGYTKSSCCFIISLLYNMFGDSGRFVGVPKLPPSNITPIETRGRSRGTRSDG